jgi:secreted Zn-dependent insulinase-like peptidase
MASLGSSAPGLPPINSHEAVERLADSLEAPSLDTRSYRVIRLPNQLEALLVHDPETDKASAAMDVNVGNFSDEEDMPGMAHAVEHLLFMGTKKVRSYSCVREFQIYQEASYTQAMEEIDGGTYVSED